MSKTPNYGFNIIPASEAATTDVVAWRESLDGEGSDSLVNKIDTELKKVENKIDNGNFASRTEVADAIQVETDNRVQAVNAETQARTEKDTELQASINAETIARESADNKSISTAEGVHGIRYQSNKLQRKDGDSWFDIVDSGCLPYKEFTLSGLEDLDIFVNAGVYSITYSNEPVHGSYGGVLVVLPMPAINVVRQLLYNDSENSFTRIGVYNHQNGDYTWGYWSTTTSSRRIEDRDWDIIISKEGGTITETCDRYQETVVTEFASDGRIIQRMYGPGNLLLRTKTTIFTETPAGTKISEVIS